LIIEYTPEGGEPQLLNAGRMRASEIQIIERTAPGSWDDIKEAMSRGDITAMRTVAWVVRKRTEPALRHGDFDPFEDELRVLLDDQETRDYAERLFDKWGNDPDNLAAAFDELRDAAANREACEQAIADVTAPKDPAPPAPEPEPTAEDASATA